MAKILGYLFPDSNEEISFPYPEDLGASDSAGTAASEGSLLARFQLLLSRVKSAPVDGLVWRLAVVMTHCLYVLGNKHLVDSPIPGFISTFYSRRREARGPPPPRVPA